MKNIIFKLAKNREDLKHIYDLRYKIFVEGEKYIPSTIEIEIGDNIYHLMALRDNIIIGAITLIIDDGGGLHIAKHFDLINIEKKGKIAEVRCLAVLPQERKGILPLGLIALIYEIARRKGVKHIVIDLFNREKEIQLYRQLGFEVIGTYMYAGNLILVMVIDLDLSPYAIDKEKVEIRNLFVQKLNFPDLDYV